MSEQEKEPEKVGLTGAPIPAPPLDEKEYKHILKIVNDRQTLVTAQLQQRSREIEEALEEQVKQEFETPIKDFTARGEKLFKRMTNLTKEVKKLQAEAAVEGISLSIMTGGYHDGVTVGVMDLHAEIHRRLTKLKVLKGGAEINFKLSTLEAKEALALGQITSARARELLENLPTLDQLLPIQVEDVKRLQAGNEEEAASDEEPPTEE